MKKLGLLGSVVWFTACGSPQHELQSGIERSEVPSSHRDYAVLGQAYHADQKRFLNVACVNGLVSEEYGNTEAEVKLENDIGFSDVVNRLGGKLSIDVTFPVVRAGASAHYGSEMSASEHVNNYHFSWKVTPKKRVFIPGSYTLTDLGKEFAESSKAHLLEKCGNEFVSAIEYGASLNVNLRLEYRNEEDKKDIGGKLQVGVGSQGIDIVKVEGDLNYLTQEVKKSVKITVQAIQRGGNPLQLLKIVPNNLISCTLEKPEPCFQVFSEAVRYAKEDLISQFESQDSYNVIKYYTERYDESGIASLVPSSYPSLDLLVDNARMELDERFQDSLMDSERAGRLLSTYSEWLSPEQQSEIKLIEKKAKSNARLFSQAAMRCYDNPYEGCLEIVDQAKQAAESYDRKYLSIPAEDVSVFFKCEYARMLAVENGLVSSRFAVGYQKRGWAPIFHNYRMPEHGIHAWGECREVLKTYGDDFGPKA